MGRAKGKGKKQMVIEIGSDEEKKVPVVVQRRRGRPLKSLKEEVEVVVESVGEEEDVESVNDLKNQTGKKRKRSSIVKENSPNSNGDDNGVVVAIDEPVRPVGFRQNGSRRKSKPRRAAEVGVECN
ncbi:uncharacterized protein LOC124935966 [Impatiens glandulifera]|uniref:uncharacterized protein LOC124935966 n=1 Tax=Impatiens glandulifera TaxID=253017 RepID=UPI001FB18341|nr:uncharacterized protein LOC124935966 [Impatiens glandulifera]